MDFVKNLKEFIKKEIDNNVSVKLLITLGYTNLKNKYYFDSNISKNNFYRIKNSLKKYDVNNNFNSQHYFYKDLELINCNEESICIKHNDTIIKKYINNGINKSMYNFGSLKVKLINKSIVNDIYFPAFKNYIEYLDKKNSIFVSKYRNSDIKIIFEEIKNHNTYNIHFSFSCDESNYDNIIKNFIFILNLIYYKKLNFSEILF